jgi:hypothetical protein
VPAWSRMRDNLIKVLPPKIFALRKAPGFRLEYYSCDSVQLAVDTGRVTKTRSKGRPAIACIDNINTWTSLQTAKDRQSR